MTECESDFGWSLWKCIKGFDLVASCFIFLSNGTDSPDCQSTSSVEEIFPSVQDCIRSLVDSGTSSSALDNKSPESSPKVKRKHQPSLKAFEMFEAQGIVIVPGRVSKG